jgi:hypothetical protein
MMGSICVITTSLFFLFQISNGSIDGYTVHPGRKFTVPFEVLIRFPKLDKDFLLQILPIFNRIGIDARPCTGCLYAG